jgi:predicted DNA-binding protein with PD1-like motif
MSHCVKRLSRGHDLKRSMAELMESSGMRAAVVASLVGSLTHAKLRAAGGQKILDITGPIEITGATGTLSPTGMHVHIAIADANGATFGGHLIEGCIVSSTVEVVLSEVAGWQFNRLVDADTGHQELVAQKVDR